MTVSDAERGRDVRASTLQALIRALPGESAWDLLAPGELSPAQAWGWRRDLFGCEVDEETKRVEIAPDGDAHMRLETRGLRLLAPRTGPLRLRVGFSVPTVVPSRAMLRAVAAPADRAGVIRITSVTGTQAERLHELVVPEKLARSGVTFTRDMLHRAVYALTAERAAQRMGVTGTFHEGASFAAVLPVRRLRLVVKFPPGRWPEDITSHAWPMHAAPDPSVAGVGGWLHPEGLGFEANERRRTVSLSVERPIIGAKYGLGWRLR